MNLLIENGILLKPYSAPLGRDGKHRRLKGWTPDRTSYEINARFDEFKAKSPDMPDYLIWAQVENEEGKRLAMLRRPWPGWIPVPAPVSGKATDEDRRISKAYRELFQRMNPERGNNAHKLPEAEWPPDGLYEFVDGEMIHIE